MLYLKMTNKDYYLIFIFYLLMMMIYSVFFSIMCIKCYFFSDPKAGMELFPGCAVLTTAGP